MCSLLTRVESHHIEYYHQLCGWSLIWIHLACFLHSHLFHLEVCRKWQLLLPALFQRKWNNTNMGQICSFDKYHCPYLHQMSMWSHFMTLLLSQKMDVHINLFFWVLSALWLNTCPFERHNFLSQMQGILYFYSWSNSFRTENGQLTISQISR